MNFVRKVDVEEQMKRQAVMSQIVMTKQYKLSLFSAIILFQPLLTLGACEKLQDGSVVVWRRS